MQKRYSVAQNIDQMFFAEGAPLRAEFNALYASLFKNPKPYVQTVRVLGTKKAGMTRSEIVKNLGKETGGTVTDILKDLELCGFIRAYNSIGKTTKDSLYQLIDNYTLFYFKFFEETHGLNPEFWSQNVGRPLYLVWSGLATASFHTHISNHQQASILTAEINDGVVPLVVDVEAGDGHSQMGESLLGHTRQHAILTQQQKIGALGRGETETPISKLCGRSFRHACLLVDARIATRDERKTAISRIIH